MCQKNPE